MTSSKVTKLVNEDLYIGNMTCINCQTRIQRALEGAKGVQSVTVSYADSTAHISYDAALISRKQISKLLNGLGYSLLEKPKKAINGSSLAAIAIGVLAVFLILSSAGFSALTGEFPLAEQGMGIGMLFIIGLLTSLHCVAMCGGINISQCIPAVVAGAEQQAQGSKKDARAVFAASESQNAGTAPVSSAKANAGTAKAFKSTKSAKSTGLLSKLHAFLPSLSYNLGRVVSYTLIGALVGLLGSAITPSGAFKGAIQLIAGVFMVFMALSMLDVIPSLRRFVPHLPAPLAKLLGGVARGKSPLVVGLLNGLMPCGPLQAMQLYALSTASPVEGALSMLAFSLGTVPLMFGLGALSSLLTERFTKKLMVAGASLVMLLGLFMFSSGWTLSNLPAPPNPVAAITNSFSSFLVDDSSGSNSTGAQGGSATTGGGQNSKTSSGKDVAVQNSGTQVVQSTLKSNKYPAIEVAAGLPVRWEINAPSGSITGCNNRMIIPEYQIQHSFKTGANVIEFTPEKPGTYRYSCWMGMITSTITVV